MARTLQGQSNIMSTRAEWRKMFNLLKEMRANIVAPVDTIGCASLADFSESPKDEVTAAAVERLKKLPKGLNVPCILETKEDTLAEIIKPVGFYRRKAKSLKAIAKILADDYNQDIPHTAEELMSLPGIGPKMAYLALQHAWDLNAGIGVDVHVHRISNRLGWVSTREPEETRVELESFIPSEYWKELNHLMVGFGQTVCKAKNPLCVECKLNSICPSSTVKPR